MAQLPNAPLCVALGGWLTATLTDGSAHAHARAVFVVGLSAWAWGEMTSGVNWFRRALGVGGLAFAIATLGVSLIARR